MNIQHISNTNRPFGSFPLQQTSATGNRLGRISATIQNATIPEKIELFNALGITPTTIKGWKTKLESHNGDIISGEILPNIDVTTKGTSPMETAANVVNVELARIRGQLKRVSVGDLNL